MTRLALGLACIVLATPLAARDSLGVFDTWAAFSDAAPKRCYAIARPQGAADGAFASIATWPERKLRGQVHFVLSREVADKAPVRLQVAGRSFALVAKGRNAWAADAPMDAAIIAALRSATSMSITARSTTGRSFTDRYPLAGAATAIDAASVGCAAVRS
ncbi:MAG: invasion associated locus B family protein [Erythrobacter sp.]